MQNSRLHLSIAFGDVILPIINCDDGLDRVPLKQICDQIGLDWSSQRRKLIGDDYLTKRFGLILGGDIPALIAQIGIKRDPVLIRIDRVTAFLNTINPQKVRAHGNINAADWLETKHEEWDDALHNYETYGTTDNREVRAFKVVDALAKIDRMKNASMRQLSAKQLNDELGLDIPIANQGGLDV